MSDRDRNPVQSDKNEPRALQLHASGELAHRAEQAAAMLSDCRICPRECRVNRMRGQRGFCGIGSLARVASHGPHHGEESVLVWKDGTLRGSGTIFFSGCSLGCSFCQNHDISHHPVGRETDVSALAEIMVRLQMAGCININLVTPSHVVPQLLEAINAALDQGLRLPIVYNSSGYDSMETLALLDGVIDIYMPDFKFWNDEGSAWLPDVADYAQVATAAIREMHRQVGDLKTVNGVAVSGLLVRHLVMPRRAANSRAIISFLAALSPNTCLNVMEQYRPNAAVRNDPEIGAPLIQREYTEVVDWAREAGLAAP